jgi:hypothetical protein
LEYSTDIKILYSAEKLFAEKGFAATSTRDIAKSAGVNVSMISYYFGSKEKLFEEIFKVRMKEGHSFATEILENPYLNDWEKLTKIVENYIKRVKNLPEFYTILQSVHTTKCVGNEQILRFLRTSKMGYIKMYQKLLDEGFKNKIFTKNPNFLFVHSVIVGTVFYSKQGINLYQEFSENKSDEYYEIFYNNLTKNLITLLKDLLGYEEKK